MTDPDTTPQYGNLRYVLRAYETPDAARLAVMLILANEPEVSRTRLAAMWEHRRPADAAPGQFRTIRARIGRGANLLQAAGGLRRVDTLIRVTNWDVIAMCARNLEILETPAGMTLSPGQWSRRPEAPPHLHHLQQQLESNRAANATATARKYNP